MLLFIGGQAFV